jgi:hypothetical protein
VSPEVQMVVVEEVKNWRRMSGTVAKNVHSVVYYPRLIL